MRKVTPWRRRRAGVPAAGDFRRFTPSGAAAS